MGVSERPYKTYTVTVPSDPSRLGQVERLAGRVARELAFSEDEADSLAIAVTEAVNNAMHHGNKLDKRKKVRVYFELFANRTVVHVIDEGQGFDPGKLQDPLRPENVLKESGRGIFILRALMDDVRFCFSHAGTEVILVKRRRDQ